jgi:hypothetical protein
MRRLLRIKRGPWEKNPETSDSSDYQNDYTDFCLFYSVFNRCNLNFDRCNLRFLSFSEISKKIIDKCSFLTICIRKVFLDEKGFLLKSLRKGEKL